MLKNHYVAIEIQLFTDSNFADAQSAQSQGMPCQYYFNKVKLRTSAASRRIKNIIFCMKAFFFYHSLIDIQQ